MFFCSLETFQKINNILFMDTPYKSFHEAHVYGLYKKHSDSP